MLFWIVDDQLSLLAPQLHRDDYARLVDEGEGTVLELSCQDTLRVLL